MKGGVLLTGATGLIGGEIAWRLMKSGRRVWCVVRSKTFSEAAARLERRFALSGEQCDWSRIVGLPGDVTQEGFGMADETVNHLRNECAQVIHCAADTSFAAHDRCCQVNQVSTQNVLRICQEMGSPVRLLHMSSAVTCMEPVGGLVREGMPHGGFVNGYVRSKRDCEQMVLQSSVDSVVLRPSIVLSNGVDSREFARSVLWVFPVIRALGVLPMIGDERIDAVSVDFVAKSVVRMLERPLDHRIYHLSAGVEASVSWRDLFKALTEDGHDSSGIRFDSEMDWKTLGTSNPRLCRLTDLVEYYLPFMRADVVYDCSRLKQALADDFPSCPRATDYCAQLLDMFTEREAFEEAFNP